MADHKHHQKALKHKLKLIGHESRLMFKLNILEVDIQFDVISLKS